MRRLVFVVLGVLSLGVFTPAQVNISSPAAVKDQASSATGSAAPATAIYAGVVSSGNLAGLVACDSSAQITVSTATTTQIIALVSGKVIYVCGFVINGAGATTTKLVYGTGTNCATGQVNLTPPFTLASGSNLAAFSGLGYLMKTAAANAICVTNSAAVGANVFVSYTQF